MKTSLYNVLSKNWGLLLFLFCFSFIATFFNSLFSYLYGDFNPWSDINIYYTIGKGIFFDKVPYKDLFDHKGPFIFYIYYLGYVLSPNSYQGMYVIESLFLFVELIYVYRIARLFCSKAIAIVAPCIFTTLLYSFSYYGGSAEEFILVFIVISLFYIIKYLKADSIEHDPWSMFIHGILFSLTFYSKLNLCSFWVLPIISIFGFLLYHKKYRNLVKNLLYFFLAIVLVSIFTLLYFYLNGAVGNFVEAYITLNLKYGSLDSKGMMFTYILRSYSYMILLVKTYYMSSIFVMLGLFASVFFIPKNKYFFILVLFGSFVLLYYSFMLSKLVHYYYLIIYLAFSPLGIAYCLKFVDRISKDKKTIKQLFCSIACLVCIVLTLKANNFFGYSLGDLKDRNLTKNNNVYVLSNYVKDKDFFCLGISAGIDLFYLNKQVPTVRYFFTPNVDPTQDPELYEAQKSYIRNRKTEMIVYKYFPYENEFLSILENSGYKEIFRDEEGYAIFSCR